jgi:hypothetical protein
MAYINCISLACLWRLLKYFFQLSSYISWIDFILVILLQITDQMVTQSIIRSP